ncbi:MAG TPA: hypothetical protein VK841_26900, partial [Polyangiaceae bacterium]|nr:hypothetical protein [Polyangiaceae bacterium]
VGTAVCTSGVCDTTNSECGLVDGKSCADAGASVCQSGTCNAQGTCGATAPPGCTLDTDCSAAQWCNTGTGTCSPKLGNGTLVPTVSGHTPPLTGTCSAAVGTAVCISSVCDISNNECGLVDGNSCADAGASVCQSGTCNSQDTCGVMTGCTQDTDCSPTQWCNTSTGACSGKLGNGTAVPTIAGHTPPLAGACTAATGAAVCASGVCDPSDNACGLAKGDGPCTTQEGAKVCRTGVCLADFSVCGDAYVPSGSGFGCSMTRAGETAGTAGASVGMALLAAFASIGRRRRVAKRTE